MVGVHFVLNRRYTSDGDMNIIIIIIINTFKYANFIKKLLMESPLRRLTTAD